MTVRRSLLFVFVFSLILVTFQFSLFGFRTSDDGPQWVRVSEFLVSSNRNPSNVSSHYTFNPLIPLMLLPLRYLSGSYLSAYSVLNFFAMILSPCLLYLLTKKLTNNELVAIISGILLSLDFYTQLLGTEMMPDVFTWAYTLTLLNLAAEFWQQKERLSIRSALIWGGANLIGIFLKMNLAFFFFLYPFVLWQKQKKDFIPLTILSGIIAIAPPMVYYFSLTVFSGHFAGQSLLEGKNEIKFNFMNYPVSLLSAFLYTWPFILLGLNRSLFWRNKFVLAALALTVLPLIIWPYVMGRFFFTTFWLLFPIVAFGIIRFAGKKKLIIAAILGGLFLLGTLRVFLTFNRQSHLDFIQSGLTPTIRLLQNSSKY